jgi:hypothetical protein
VPEAFSVELTGVVPLEGVAVKEAFTPLVRVGLKSTKNWALFWPEGEGMPTVESTMPPPGPQLLDAGTEKVPLTTFTSPLPGS